MQGSLGTEISGLFLVLLKWVVLFGVGLAFMLRLLLLIVQSETSVLLHHKSHVVFDVHPFQ